MSDKELPAEDESTSKIGQKLEVKPRTEDIRIDEDVSFSALNLDTSLLQGLHREQFNKPSPIQLAAIPVGRCGVDLVVQAKSGTGKTAVFAILALEAVDVFSGKPQVLMLAPTREIALQIAQVVTGIGCEVKGLVCHCSIGGVPLKEDRKKVNKAHIVIGTPGRVKQLMELSVLDARHVRLFVLDEADKLLEDNFQDQMNWIYNGLPGSKRVIAASATYKEKEVEHLRNYMQDPICVRLNSSDPVLLGVRQYKKLIPSTSLPNDAFDSKVAALIDVLSRCQFQQCLVFSNLASRAASLSMLMVSKGWPATHIAGSLEQEDRAKAISSLQSYECRVLISTDLTSRGIDASRIDLVINLDLPYDCETYLHRVGRCGRFGAKGAAITIISQSEAMKLDRIAEEINTEILELPDEPCTDLISNPAPLHGEKTVQVEVFRFEDLFNSSASAEERRGGNFQPITTADKQGAGDAQSQSSGEQSGEVETTLVSDGYANGVDTEEQVCVGVNGDVEDKHSAERVEGVNEKAQEVTTPHVGITSTRGQAVAGTSPTVDVISSSVKEELVLADEAENVGHRPPFSSLGEARKFIENPVLHRAMLDTSFAFDVRGDNESKVTLSHGQLSSTGVVLSSEVVSSPKVVPSHGVILTPKVVPSRGVVCSSQPELSSAKPKKMEAIKADRMQSNIKSGNISPKQSEVSSCPPPNDQYRQTTWNRTERAGADEDVDDGYGGNHHNHPWYPHGYHATRSDTHMGVVGVARANDEQHFSSCAVSAGHISASAHVSRPCRHTDRDDSTLSQTLSTHCRLVYMQHSYIRAMAARCSGAQL